MNTRSEIAPPEPPSLLYSYNSGNNPEVTATTEKMIPLFARSANHIERDANAIIVIPNSQDTMFSDHSIQMLEPISATTSGVNVATDHPKVVTPFSRIKYIV